MYILQYCCEILWCLIKKHDKNYSFSSMVAAGNDAGTGQVMAECVSLDANESYGTADLGAKKSERVKNLQIKRLVEKPSATYAPSNLAVLGRYIIPSAELGLLETTVAGVGG